MHANQARNQSFSLRALLLLVTIVAMATGLFSLYRTNRQLVATNDVLSAENRRLRDEVGELSIDDQDVLHAIRVASGEELEWAWRIWIPRGHEYSLRCKGGRVPEEGLPKSGGTMFLRTPGEHVIRYSIRRDPVSNDWRGALSTRTGSVGADNHAWVEWDSKSSTTSGIGTTTKAVSIEQRGTVELCRHLVSRADSTDQIEGPAPGFVIWLIRTK